MKKLFLISSLNLLQHNLRPFPLSLSTCHKKPTPTWLPPPFRWLWRAIRSLQISFAPGWTTFAVSAAPHQTCASKLLPLWLPFFRYSKFSKVTKYFFSELHFNVVLKMKIIFLCGENGIFFFQICYFKELSRYTFWLFFFVPFIYCMCLHWNRDLKDHFHLCFKTHNPTTSPQIIFFLAVFNSHCICSNKYWMKKKRRWRQSIVVIRLLWK